jgi:hypothetical protein
MTTGAKPRPRTTNSNALMANSMFAGARRLLAWPEWALAITAAMMLAALGVEWPDRFAVLAAMSALLSGAVLTFACMLRLALYAGLVSRAMLFGAASAADCLPGAGLAERDGRRRARIGIRTPQKGAANVPLACILRLRHPD